MGKVDFWNPVTEEENTAPLQKIIRPGKAGVDVDGVIDEIYHKETKGEAVGSTI